MGSGWDEGREEGLGLGFGTLREGEEELVMVRARVRGGC